MRQRLVPWQSLPDVACRSCGDQATRRVLADDTMLDLGTGTATLYLGGGAPSRIEYGCEQHAQQIAEAMLDDGAGSAGSEPLRDSWSYYLTGRVPGLRWIGSFEVWIWNGWAEEGLRNRLHWLVHGRGWRERLCGGHLVVIPLTDSPPDTPG